MQQLKEVTVPQVPDGLNQGQVEGKLPSIVAGMRLQSMQPRAAGRIRLVLPQTREGLDREANASRVRIAKGWQQRRWEKGVSVARNGEAVLVSSTASIPSLPESPLHSLHSL